MIKIIIVAFLGFSSNLFSQENKLDLKDTLGWIKIGETIVNFEHERNEIKILSKDKFTKLKYFIKLAPVEMDELVVNYKKGDQQNFKAKEKVKSEGYIQILELNGQERQISSVIIQSNTIPYLREDKEIRALIEIFGKNELK